MILKYILLADLIPLITIIEDAKDIYQKNSNPKCEIYAICKKYARISELTVKFGLTIYCSWVLVESSTSTYDWIITGIRKPALSIYFPGVYEYSHSGFILLSLYNYIIVAICAVLTPSGDLLLFLVFANVPLISADIQTYVNKFDVIMESTDSRDKILMVKKSLIEYHLMHKKYNE